MPRESVLPVNEQSHPMFTLIDPNGDDLHKHLMELNRAHADEEVRKNTGEALVSELERIRDNLQAKEAVSRQDIQEVEATSGVAIESMPLMMFTERPSKTGYSVALEAIDVRQAAIIGTGVVAALGLLIKIISWIKNRSSGDGSKGGGSGGSIAKAIEHADEGKEEVTKAVENGPKTLSLDDKKTITEYLAAYLDSRTLLQDKCIGRDGYAIQYLDIVSSFEKRIETASELVASITEAIEATVNDGSIEEIESIINKVNLDPVQFDKWPECLRLVKALGAKPKGDSRLADVLHDALTILQNEATKPTKLRTSDLTKNNVGRISRELDSCLEALHAIESLGNPDSSCAYYSKEVLARANKVGEEELGKLTPLQVKFKEGLDNITSSGVKLGQLLSGGIGAITYQLRIISYVMAIGELIAVNTAKVTENTAKLSSKATEIASV